jgi:hypothetical protein
MPTPSLIQEYVPGKLELRVYYALGEFLALALQPSVDHVDIRHVPAGELETTVYDIAPSLRKDLARIATGLSLEYCAFDVLIRQDDEPALIDITPNGDWDYFESDSSPIVTEFLCDTILRAHSRMLQERSR